jgi:hypothetical protein
MICLLGVGSVEKIEAKVGSGRFLCGGGGRGINRASLSLLSLPRFQLSGFRHQWESHSCWINGDMFVSHLSHHYSQQR